MESDTWILTARKLKFRFCCARIFPTMPEAIKKLANSLIEMDAHPTLACVQFEGKWYSMRRVDQVLEVWETENLEINWKVPYPCQI